MDLQAAVDSLVNMPPILAYGALFFGAFVEYVVPPFPGDTVVVAGVALVVALGWPLTPVFTAVTLGAATGGLTAYGLGRWAARSGTVDRLGPKKRAAVRLIVSRFERWGASYLAINRFVPGVRALFFVAAGLADLRPAPVLFWALVSATAWNALLVGLGIGVGGNVDTLALWMSRHTFWVGVAVTLILMGASVRIWLAVRTLGPDNEPFPR